MKPEEQRFAICEWANWEPPLEPSTSCLWSLLGIKYFSDPLKDLNAIHEAESMLTNSQWDDQFYHWLGFVVSGGQTEQLWEYRKMIVHATAEQRCEALCRTLWPDKWKNR